jgi:hypothetical protein
MATATLRKEEAFGLGLAVAAHVVLFAWLALGTRAPAPLALPDKMTVTLSEDVALQSSSPEPAAVAPAPDRAPELGEAPPQPAVRLVPQPLPRLAPAPRPVPQPKLTAPLRATPAPALRPAGASRIGSDFLKGATGASASGTSQTSPAATIGPAVRSALAGAISRQLKPRWTAPQGIDAEKLVTILSWSINKDGSLAGTPRVVRQDGITDANRAQAARHAEQAVRAVQLAAPFNLPAEYYDAWKRIADFRFDRKLSQ